MNDVFICDAIRTPFGRYGGALASIRADDLAALPIRALIDRNPNVDWEAVDDVIFGCANQAGEDNRNVGRMALLLAGLPETVPGTTVNRLCGSSLDAIAIGARAIKSGEADLIVAGGVESMSRAPFVLAKADAAFSRNAEIYDTTIGWRFVNSRMQKLYGIDSMPETAENVAEQFQVSRQDQDAFALRSHQRWAAAHQAGFFKRQLVPVELRQKKSEYAMVASDEHPRPDTTLEALANLSLGAYYAGDLEDALARARQAQQIDPAGIPGWIARLLAALVHQGGLPANEGRGKRRVLRTVVAVT